MAVQKYRQFKNSNRSKREARKASNRSQKKIFAKKREVYMVLDETPYTSGPSTIEIPSRYADTNGELMQHAKVIMYHDGKVILDPSSYEDGKVGVIKSVAKTDNGKFASIEYIGNKPPMEVCVGLIKATDWGDLQMFKIGKTKKLFQTMAFVRKSNGEYMEVEEVEIPGENFAMAS